jgi:hypothetical protein
MLSVVMAWARFPRPELTAKEIAMVFPIAKTLMIG